MNHAQPPASTTASTPAAAGHSVPNGISATITRCALDNHPSPATDSPKTPVDIILAPDVKIDMDYQEQESDVRHEPLPVKQLDHHAKFEADSGNYGFCLPSLTFDLLSGTLPISTPPDANGNGHLNGHHPDVVMTEADAHTPGATPGISGDFSMASIDGGSNGSATRSYPDDDDDDQREPPAKRMRTSQDVTMAHVSLSLFSVRRSGRADQGPSVSRRSSKVRHSTSSIGRRLPRSQPCTPTALLRRAPADHRRLLGIYVDD